MSQSDLGELKESKTISTPIKGVYRLGDKVNSVTYWGQEKMVNKNITAMFVCGSCGELWRVAITRIKNGTTTKCKCK